MHTLAHHRTSCLASIIACLMVAILMAGCHAATPEPAPEAPTGGIEETRKVIEENSSGLFMYTLKDSNDYEVFRTEPAGDPIDVEPDTWTIFVYLCGSDLESDKGAASRDLSEMLAATASDKVKIVVETGGAKAWKTDGVDATKIQRHLIQNNKMALVDEFDQANMSLAETLADFLRWGVTNYPADKMAAVLWDHGGGSAKGLCMDENYDFDTMDLHMLDQALNAALLIMDRKFEFIGFDACLMGTLECANVVATYANYMVASEEWEPGTGWPYTDFLSYVAENPTASGGEVGRVVCDAFKPTGERAERLTSATLATYDLSKLDALLQAFNTFSAELFDATSDVDTFTDVVRAANEVENFGGNNHEEGFTNMVDLGCLTEACAPYVQSSGPMLDALHDVVIYHVSGPTHAKAHGMSVYFPLRVGRRRQLSLFQSVCVNPSYLAFVDRIVRAASSDGEDLASVLQTYDNEGLYVDGKWVWYTEMQSGEANEEYWSDISELSSTPYGSNLITFDSQPTVNTEGDVTFLLSEEGLKNTLRAGSMYFEYIDGDTLFLGSLFDVDIDRHVGFGQTRIDGMWLTLPDGQTLSITPVDSGDDHVIYSSPILVNDEETNLRIACYDDGHCVVEGIWSGVDDEGVVDRGTETLSEGDEIVPLYLAINQETKEQSTYEGEPYVISGKLEVSLGMLDPDYYGYALFVQDVFRNVWVSDIEEFEVRLDHTIMLD